jgi:hypothetical protein
MIGGVTTVGALALRLSLVQRKSLVHCPQRIGTNENSVCGDVTHVINKIGKE